MKKTILYLRTDMWDTELTAGGSVAHTLGVIQGFNELDFQVICASSCLDSVLKKISVQELIKLSNPLWLKPLRWKLNCFFSTFFFFFQAKKLFKKYPLACIYQRYSLLNMTGLLLSWWFQKKLILEYNGSEVWTAYQWSKKGRLFFLKRLLYFIERFTLKRADSVVVVSGCLKDELIKRGIKTEKILEVPNGVDSKDFDSEIINKKIKESAYDESIRKLFSEIENQASMGH